MTIETKYNIGDNVFFIAVHQQSDTVSLFNSNIKRIQIDTEIELRIIYELEIENMGFVYINEKSAFKTKQELIDSL